MQYLKCTVILFASLRDVQLRHARSPKLPRKIPIISTYSEIQEDIYPCSELHTNISEKINLYIEMTAFESTKKMLLNIQS